MVAPRGPVTTAAYADPVSSDPTPRRHRWDDWDTGQLLAAKGDQRVTVVIPAHDEEATVADIVGRVRAQWVERVPLVDELVVIDSDSVDRTAELAATAGAVVHSAKEIRADLGTARGKGEALWKSLHVTTGDVLAFLDADLVDWGTHFVGGLLGPLLTEPRTALVKAVYDRPMLDEQGREAELGGRVTELVARPLLALHWPELAGVVQPLSGEWAIRRSVFETLDVPVGYGVEIAALVDTARLLGAGAVAQVDLGRRTHRHHRHDTLGQMAVQVMAAALSRAGGRAVARAPDPVALRQFDGSASGFAPRVSAVDVGERPPATSVDGYADRLTS